MAGEIPNTVWLYRIVHINNIKYILTHGMFESKHEQADRNYINIGNATLMSQRQIYNVPVNPFGTLGNYIAFYLGRLSPMLLNIKTGYFGVTQRSQEDIVYICCRLDDIIESCEQWCFTNGHGKDRLTRYFNNLEHLDQVDWNIVDERYWSDNEDDFDRKRRKQAEFLVKTHVPPTCIGKIIVYNSAKRAIVESLLQELNLEIPVRVNPNNNYYYY